MRRICLLCLMAVFTLFSGTAAGQEETKIPDIGNEILPTGKMTTTVVIPPSTQIFENTTSPEDLTKLMKTAELSMKVPAQFEENSRAVIEVLNGNTLLSRAYCDYRTLCALALPDYKDQENNMLRAQFDCQMNIAIFRQLYEDDPSDEAEALVVNEMKKQSTIIHFLGVLYSHLMAIDNAARYMDLGNPDTLHYLDKYQEEIVELARNNETYRGLVFPPGKLSDIALENPMVGEFQGREIIATHYFAVKFAQHYAIDEVMARSLDAVEVNHDADLGVFSYDQDAAVWLMRE